MTKYYQTNDFLIQFNPTTQVARIKNNIGLTHSILSAEELSTLAKQEIKKQEFSRRLNEYFKQTPHSWEYEGVPFRKLDNFESNEVTSCANYNWQDIPKHQLPEKRYLGSLLLVYHWGRVYYFTWSYGGYPQGQLIDPRTLEIVRWAKPKHCAPILNEVTKQII